MIPSGVGVEVGVLVLLAVLVVGLVTGLAKKGRITLLLIGLVVIAVVGLVITGGVDTTAAGITEFLMVALPLAVAFAAGWLAARGSWLKRLVALGVGAVLLAAFPYAAAGEAAATLFIR